MKQQRLKLSIAFLFGLCLSGLQAQNMYVRNNTGTQTAHPLTNIKKMTFSSGNLVISNTTGVNDSYALNEVRYLNFKDLTLGVTQPNNVAQQLIVYPNPVTNVLNISTSEYSQPITNFEIISLDGRIVQRQNLNTDSQLHQVDVSGLPQGLYFCKVNYNAMTQTTKFIKQ